MNQSEDYIDSRTFKRGEIYYVNLASVDYMNPHIQNKSRPGLIIQNDVGNGTSQNVIIALLTSAEKKNYPFQYKTELNGRDTTIMFDQIMTLPKSLIESKMGELASKQTIEADAALMCSLGLSQYSIINLTNINLLSVIIERTKTGKTAYCIFETEYAIGVKDYKSEIKISLNDLKKFDQNITEDSSIDDIRNKFNNCAGLNFLINHTA